MSFPENNKKTTAQAGDAQSAPMASLFGKSRANVSVCATPIPTDTDVEMSMIGDSLLNESTQQATLTTVTTQYDNSLSISNTTEMDCSVEHTLSFTQQSYTTVASLPQDMTQKTDVEMSMLGHSMTTEATQNDTFSASTPLNNSRNTFTATALNCSLENSLSITQQSDVNTSLAQDLTQKTDVDLSMLGHSMTTEATQNDTLSVSCTPLDTSRNISFMATGNEGSLNNSCYTAANLSQDVSVSVDTTQQMYTSLMDASCASASFVVTAASLHDSATDSPSMLNACATSESFDGITNAHFEDENDDLTTAVSHENALISASEHAFMTSRSLVDNCGGIVTAESISSISQNSLIDSADYIHTAKSFSDEAMATALELSNVENNVPMETLSDHTAVFLEHEQNEQERELLECMSKLSTHVDTLEFQLKEIKDQNEKKAKINEEEKEDLKEKIKNLEAALEIAERYSLDSRKTAANAAAQASELQTALGQAEENIRKYKAEVSSLFSDVARSNQLISELESKLNEATKEREILAAKFAAEKVEMQELLEVKEQRIKWLEEACDDFDKDEAEYRQQIFDLVAENNRLKGKPPLNRTGKVLQSALLEGITRITPDNSLNENINSEHSQRDEQNKSGNFTPITPVDLEKIFGQNNSQMGGVGDATLSTTMNEPLQPKNDQTTPKNANFPPKNAKFTPKKEKVTPKNDQHRDSSGRCVQQ